MAGGRTCILGLTSRVIAGGVLTVAADTHGARLQSGRLQGLD